MLGVTGSGDFSVKLATWKAKGTFEPALSPWKFNWIWKSDIRSKIQIFLWQVYHHALPSRSTLLQRGLTIDPICPACLSQIEDTQHLFANYPFAARFGIGKETWLDLPNSFCDAALFHS